VTLITKVFNMLVEIPVENRSGIFVTDSARDASALCTGAGAGTFWVVPLGLLFPPCETFLSFRFVGEHPRGIEQLVIQGMAMDALA
jgi:hypothetical protein